MIDLCRYLASDLPETRSLRRSGKGRSRCGAKERRPDRPASSSIESRRRSNSAAGYLLSYSARSWRSNSSIAARAQVFLWFSPQRAISWSLIALRFSQLAPFSP